MYRQADGEGSLTFGCYAPDNDTHLTTNVDDVPDADAVRETIRVQGTAADYYESEGYRVLLWENEEGFLFLLLQHSLVVVGRHGGDVPSALPFAHVDGLRRGIVAQGHALGRQLDAALPSAERVALLVAARGSKEKEARQVKDCEVFHIGYVFNG